MLSYEQLVIEISNRGMTQLAGLFCHIAETAWKSHCFQSGGMARICERIEKRNVLSVDNSTKAKNITLTCEKCFKSIASTTDAIHSKCECGGIFHLIGS